MALIRPKIKLKGNKAAGLKQLQVRLEAAKGAYATVGVHQDAGKYADGTSVVDVALWNEFGTGKIPERSFLRSAINDNAKLINAWREEALINILEKGWTVEKALEMIGFRVQILVQNKIKSNMPPANAAQTLARKQKAGVSPQTLIFSGLLLRSIGYKVFVKDA